MCTIKACIMLSQELDKAKETLSHLNENIHRLVGREPKDQRSDRKRLMCIGVRSNDFKDNSGSNKRRYDGKSVFSRLTSSSPRLKNKESLEDIKPRVNSRVIRELPSRQEIVAAQGTDEASRARNRRIFGSLLGTLHKFCQEESRLKQREEKKAKIEKKLEEQETQEKEAIRKERETLLVDRKQTQMKILKLECKISRIRDYETWEKNKLYQNKFILTQTKPQIFFLPKNMDKQSEKLLKLSNKEIKNVISKRRIDLIDELLDIDNRFGLNDSNDHFANQKYISEVQINEMTFTDVQESSENCTVSSTGTKKKLKRLMSKL